MKCPSPELLDLFYRCGAFPIDDLDVRATVHHTSSVFASTWYVPTRTIPAIFFVMGGGSGDLSALIYELRRLAVVTEYTANAMNWPASKRVINRGICYHYLVQVTHIDSRIYNKSVEEWDDGITPMLHAAALHTWFNPMTEYDKVYEKGYISIENLPASNMSDEDSEYLGDPDAPVAKKIVKKPTQGSHSIPYGNGEIDDETDKIHGGIRLSDIKLSESDLKILGLDVEDDV